MNDKTKELISGTVSLVVIAATVIVVSKTMSPDSTDYGKQLDSLDAEVDSLRYSRETDRLRHQAQMDSLGCLIGSMEDRRKEGERRLRSLIQSPEDWFNSLPKEGRAAINGKLNSKIAETL